MFPSSSKMKMIIGEYTTQTTLNNMKKENLKIFILFAFAVLISSCGKSEEEWKSKNGTPDEILGDSYEKLVEQYKFIGNFEEGSVIVMNGGKYGLVSYYGDCVLPCEYDTITSIDKSSRIVCKNGKYGIVEYNADFIAECKYDSCLVPSPRFCPIMVNGKWGVISRKGEKVIPNKYDDIQDYNDTIFVAKYNGKYGIVSYEDKPLIDFKCDRIYIKAYGEASYIEINNKIALVNSKYQQVTEPLFGVVIIDWFDKDGCASLRMVSTNKCGLVDVETGKTLIPFEYDKLGWYSEGLVSVLKNGKWGYADKSGQIVIPFIYDDANDFSEGLALVSTFYGTRMCRGGILPECHYGFIDKKGKVVIPLKFADQSLCGNDGFHEGLAAIGDFRADNIYAGKIGYIDKTGKFVIQPQYDSADGFFMGLAVVSKDERAGVINKKNEIIIPFVYEYGSVSKQDSTITMDNDVYIITKNGCVKKKS